MMVYGSSTVVNAENGVADATPPTSGAAASAGPFSVLTTFGTSSFWRFANDTARHPYFFYRSEMTIDGDGAPNCYGPGDVNAIDFLENAGYPGNWWALVTDNGQPSGNPLRQKATDPFPGLYISMTSLANESLPDSNPRKWSDATAIPYFVMPDNKAFLSKSGAQIGDLGLVVHNGKTSFAIFADESGDDVAGHVGEGSVFLSQRLGHDPYDSNHKITKSIEGNTVFYFAFPGTSLDRPMTIAEIESRGNTALQQWGGMARVQWVISNWPEK